MATSIQAPDRSSPAPDFFAAYGPASDNYMDEGDMDGLFDENFDIKDEDATLPIQNVPADSNDELGGILAEGGDTGDFDLNNLNDREIGGGDKADDAVDYGDISDDELPEEEKSGGPVQEPSIALGGIMEYADNEDNDLFGDADLFGDGPSSPMGVPDQGMTLSRDRSQGEDAASDLASEHASPTSRVAIPEPPLDLDERELRLYAIQQALFSQTGKAVPVTQEENLEQWLKHEFPGFDRNEIPQFHRLFPPRQRRYIGKTPLKPPKPIRPMKVNLELDQDQKTAFNSNASRKRPWEGDGSVVLVDDLFGHELSEDETVAESDLDEPLPGGLSMQELDIICADFDTLSQLADSDAEMDDILAQSFHEDTEMLGVDEFPHTAHPAKKCKLGLGPHDIVSINRFDLPSFDDPERLAQKIAKRVVLDLNDQQLLIEEIAPESLRAKNASGEPTRTAKSVKDLLIERFNNSNDAEYELLKQNHQSKVRSTLGNLTIEHSVPALRLQFPYYKVKLDIIEARKFHRPSMLFKVGMNVHFSKLNKLKRKQMKMKKVKEAFECTKSLSLADNSTALLLEYSEEHPPMMSQVGMGVKFMNYYRRKTKDDSARPKADIGETGILLPEDKSPFHIFGHIEPGETIKALYNSMYRAPIFDQEPKSQDFLVVRTYTGLEGSHYYLRNIDHLFVVGQEFPSVAIPKNHSRAVTTAAKNRLKAISYRIARRKKNHRLRVEDITKHFPETTDMQNRQKMKEIMQFNKEQKEWEMKDGEPIPDEEFIQTLIRPEDVCLLESTQVGQQYLVDAGVAQDDNEDEDDAGDAEDEALELELAPWKTSKNFINATQGKAMLKLHGDGDPSGRGEAFSFIKTSMKGGFKAIGESVMDRMEAKKELGGHSYNVARQQRSYEDSIRRIWDAQKAALSSTIEHSEGEMDEGVDGQEENAASTLSKQTPRSSTATPAPPRRRDDESVTSSSRRSVGSANQKVLRIVRTVRRNGQVVEEEYIERDPAVIKQYKKRRAAIDGVQIKYATFLVWRS